MKKMLFSCAGVDDWVEEEYTGSLANSQVFTPSAQSEPTALHGPSPNNNSFPIIQDEEESNERLQERIHVTTAEVSLNYCGIAPRIHLTCTVPAEFTIWSFEWQLL